MKDQGGESNLKLMDRSGESADCTSDAAFDVAARCTVRPSAVVGAIPRQGGKSDFSENMGTRVKSAAVEEGRPSR